MCLLTEHQIAIVTTDVENEGINFSHLCADLIDHVCCDIEYRMEQEISFSEAYGFTKKEFGIKGLRQIQQDTLMLIDKNYRIMKKSMKMIGVLAMAFMAIGAMFKIEHWPGAAFMLTVSFIFTTLVFYPTLLYVMFKEVNQKKQAVIYIISFIGGIVFMTGVLFKIMHWPDANMLFLIGVALLTYGLIPLIILLQIKKTSINKSVFLVGHISLMIFLSGIVFKIQHWPSANLLLAFGGILLILVFVPLFYLHEVRNSKKIRIDFIFGIIALTQFIVLSFFMNLSRNDSTLIDFKYQEKSFNLTAEFLNNNKVAFNSKNKLVIQFTKQADLIYNELDAIKLLIIQTQNSINKNEAIKLLKIGDIHFSKENNVNYLLSINNIKSPLPKLKADLELFKNYYNKIIIDSLSKTSVINILINTDEKIIFNNSCTLLWEEYIFNEIPPTVAINKLSFWQYKIRLAENTALSALITNPKKL